MVQGPPGKKDPNALIEDILKKAAKYASAHHCYCYGLVWISELRVENVNTWLCDLNVYFLACIY